MEFKRYALFIITALILTAATGCGGRHALWDLPQIKAAAKAITVLPPNVNITSIDGKTITIDMAADTALRSIIADELTRQLKPEFSVTLLNRGAFTYDSLFVSELKDLFASLDAATDISTVELGASIRNIFTIGANDLYLILVISGYYHSKRDAINEAKLNAAGVGVGLLTGVLSGGALIVYPHSGMKLAEGTTGCVVLSKSRNCVVFYDIDQDNDCPKEEADAREAVADILDKFLIKVQDLNVHRERHNPSTGIKNRR